MSGSQSVTKGKSANSSSVVDMRHEALIDYRALNGLVTDDDGIRKMTVDELATQLGVDRRQLYRWQESIPDFWEKVNARRAEIAPRGRLQRVHETLYLKAVKGDYQHMQLWLANFDPNFRMPTEKIEHSAGTGFADMVAAKRQAQAIEGEVVDASDQINNT